MRLHSTVLALALAGWSAGAEPAWAIASCDAFTAALRTAASDMGVDFSRAIVVSRTRSAPASMTSPPGRTSTGR